MAQPMTVAEIAAELDDMVASSSNNPTLTQRLLGRRLTVLYEFIPPEHPAEAEPATVPYLLTMAPERCTVEPVSAPYDTVDVVIRATPDTLHRMTSGELGGREAMASGLLDIRKAPSMPKLLLLRALFNAHKKAQLRAAAAASAGEPTEAG
jgi:hypothetical protein